MALVLVGLALVSVAALGQRSAPQAADTGLLPTAAESAGPPVASRDPGALAPSPAGAPPTRVVLPAIGVDAAVASVGVGTDGMMEVPAEGPGYDLAAWYRHSVSPGRRGPSVIIGHVDSRDAGPAVFFDLGRLRPGDQASVIRADDVRVVFEVYAVRTVAKDDFPTEAVYGGTPGPELRLITCGGDFDRSAGSYRANVVIFARLRP
jgi:hypothetical protein